MGVWSEKICPERLCLNAHVEKKSVLWIFKALVERSFLCSGRYIGMNIVYFILMYTDVKIVYH